MTGPTIDSYAWPGGRETMLRFGPEHGPVVIAALPLFEEANRTRAAVVEVLRQLTARGIAGVLPDLPGTGESLIETGDATLMGWRAAFAAAIATLAGPVHVMTWRGGALIDTDAAVASRWHLSPISGADTMRELRRVQAASEDATLFAGNRLSAQMIGELEAALLPPTAARSRTVRLATDPRPADAHLAFPPLWRAAEPGTDPALQAAIAEDIAVWITSCVA